MADRAPPEGLHRRSVRGCRRRGDRDRALGWRSTLRPGADGDAHRKSTWPEAILEDLRGRRCGQPSGRRACLRLRRLSGHRQRLAVLLHRRYGRPRPVIAVLPYQPGDRGRVRAHPELQAGADRVWVRVAAAARLAARQAVAPAEGRDAAPEARALRVHPRECLADHPADGGAAAARARAGRDRLDRLGPADLRHRLSALGLRRPDPGAADAAARAAAPRLLLQQRDEAVPAGLSVLPDYPNFNAYQRRRPQPRTVSRQRWQLLPFGQGQTRTVAKRQAEWL